MADIIITLPEGYPIPENVSTGDSFEALVELQLNEDGTATAKSLDGVVLGTPPDEPEGGEPTPPEVAEEASFLDAVETQMV